MFMTPKPPQAPAKKGRYGIMKISGTEQDFLREVRSARPEDCKVIISALQALDGREDAGGELTPLGFLVGAIIDELMINGILKRTHEEESLDGAAKEAEA